MLEYNKKNSKKYTLDINSNDFIEKCDVSVLLGPSTREHIKVSRNKSTSERELIFFYLGLIFSKQV